MDMEKAAFDATCDQAQSDDLVPSSEKPTSTCFAIGRSLLVLLALVNQTLFPLDVWLINPENYGSYDAGYIIAGVIAFVFVLAAQVHPRVAASEAGALLWFYGLPAICTPILLSVVLIIQPEAVNIPASNFVTAVNIVGCVCIAVAAPIANGALVDLVTTKTDTQSTNSGWTPWKRRMLYAAFFCKTVFNVLHMIGKDHVFRSLLSALTQNSPTATQPNDLAYYSICGIIAYGVFPQQAYLRQPNCILRWLTWPTWTSLRLLQHESGELTRTEGRTDSKSPIIRTNFPNGNGITVPLLAAAVHFAIFVDGMLPWLPSELLTVGVPTVLVFLLLFTWAQKLLLRSDMPKWAKNTILVSIVVAANLFVWYLPF